MAMTDGMCTTWMQRQADMSHREDEHSDLIQRACRDPNAFGELYLRHYQDVFHYCVRRLFDRHLAEDVTSIVFFKVMHHLSSFDGEAAGFRSWLLRIATNAVNDHLREARRRSEGIQRVVRDTRVDRGDAPGAADDLAERKALLQRALLSLKPKYQTVITLRFFENMKLTEIAACLGVNPSTVRTWLSRATAKLRKKLSAGSESGGYRP
jgi:RNA polymerase sigma-70 factor (ECF subfamily)